MAEDAANKTGRFTVKFRAGEDPPDSANAGSESGSPYRSGDESLPMTGLSGRHGSRDVTARHGSRDVTEDSMSENKDLYLYAEDMKKRQGVAAFLNTIMMSGNRTTYPSEKEEKAAKKVPKKAQLGMMLGVYLPTIQHILGLLCFIRHGWIVGCSGLLEACFMVFFCCLTTFVTCLSVSAIATNGMVQSGGSYYILSRNLGPECGGSIGICFYLANTLATCMYLLGAIEILLLYIWPPLAIFGDIHLDPWNNFRVYGTVILLSIALVIAVGVKFVSLFAPISLACVIISIVSIVIGAFYHDADSVGVWVCMLGERLLESPHHGWHPNDTALEWCTKNVTGDIWHRYCSDANGTEVCDSFFEQNSVSYIAAIPGIASGVASRNVFSQYVGRGEVTAGVMGDRSRGEVVSDMTTGFVVLCAIYFPSVTGILTGANMSGDLRDPQKSLPKGTIFAQLTCSFCFMLLMILYGVTVEGAVLRDKFGVSMDNQLVSALLCWPNPWVVLIGAFASSIGAALQCLTSAPRLLQAIARDDIIPFLGPFKVTTSKGEPFRALIVSFLIAEMGILVANIDSVAPVIDVFFLMCYLFVNLICVMQTLLKTPNWRPRFKYYHWTLAVLGVVLNFALCIIAGWYYALSAFLIAAFIYKYIEYKGGEKEWGDGISGLTMSTAQRALLSLGDEPHTKNWRPQILVFTKMDAELQRLTENQGFFSFAAQLKAGKGMTILASVLEGDFLERAEEVPHVQMLLKDSMKIEKAKGFAKVVVARTVTEGLSMLVQTVGLGGLRHNTVMLGWPSSWRDSQGDNDSWRVFLDTVRAVDAQGLALLVPRGIDRFPTKKSRLAGTIDVWWVVHDGGMLILLSFLLQQHKVWRGCRIRIFTVAYLTDNSIQLKKDMETFLYQIRITADVFVEEVHDTAISAYTVERTLDMEKRTQLQKEMKQAKIAAANRALHAQDRRPSARHNSIAPSTPEAVLELSRRLSSASPSDDRRGSGLAHRRPSLFHRLLFDDGARRGSAPQPPHIKILGAGEEQSSPRVVGDDNVHFTFTPTEAARRAGRAGKNSLTNVGGAQEQDMSTDSQGRLLRMHTAVQLNKTIRSKSSEAQIVIVNFPEPPAKESAQENYMEYLEMLTEGLERVLMVRGSGKEVVTMYT